MGTEQSTRNGAAALQDLIAYIGDLSDTTCSDLHDHGAEGDSRDYLGMSEMVSASLRANLAHADPLHAEGYLRALTSLLCIVADGCAPGRDWEPLRETEASFAAPAAAAALLARAVQGRMAMAGEQGGQRHG